VRSRAWAGKSDAHVADAVNVAAYAATTLLPALEVDGTAPGTSVDTGQSHPAIPNKQTSDSTRLMTSAPELMARFPAFLPSS
jgi:hypothetical protein